MNLDEIVMKLNGPINPVGESTEDEQRLKNLENLILLADSLLYKINKVVKDNTSASEYSRIKAKEVAKRFIDSLLS